MFFSDKYLRERDEIDACFLEFLAEQKRKLKILEGAKESTEANVEPNLNVKRKRSPYFVEEPESDESGHSTTVSEFSSEEELSESSTSHLKKKNAAPALYKLRKEYGKRKKSSSENPSEEKEIEKKEEKNTSLEQP